IFLDGQSAIEMYNSVVYGNDNHGIYARISSPSIIKNTIFWDNDLAQIYTPAKNVGEAEALSASYCLIQNGYTYGKNIITANPEFELTGSWVNQLWSEPYATNSDLAWRLNDLSPAIDAGDPNYCPPSPDSQDIDGDPRFVGKTVDIGFDEYVSSIPGNSGTVYSSVNDYWYWSITDALQHTAYNDQIIVSPGRYNENLIITESLDGISIAGLNPHNDEFRNATIIEATDLNTSAIIFSPGVTNQTRLAGFKITNGTGFYYPSLSEFIGGGILCDHASPSISFCRIEDNTANSGAALAIINGSPALTGCIFKNNTCTNTGPAVAALSNSQPAFYNCVFNKNTTNETGSTNNTGALHFDNNSNAANSIIRNCLFRDNQPFAIYKAGTQLLELNSTIIWNNNSTDTSADAQQIFTPDMNTFELNFCDIDGGWSGPGHENIDKDPGFKITSFLDDNGNNSTSVHDYMLGQNSTDLICINLGDYDFEPADNEVDINGHKRKDHCRVDIGPWEFPALAGIMQKIPALALAGSDWFCSVQQAADHIVAKNLQTTLQVTKGLFRENVVIKAHNMRIAGSVLFEPSEVIIDGSMHDISDTTGPFEPGDPNNPSFYGAAITLTYGQANNTTISGLTLIGGIGSLDTDGKFKGGAICSRNNNNIFIDQCIIRNNQAYEGGAIYLAKAETLAIHRTKIYQNDADNSGGAISLHRCNNATLTSSLLAANQAPYAGAIANDKSRLNISFCTIADNHSDNPGSAVLTSRAIANTTISSSIITDNTPSQLYITDSDTDKEFVVDYCCITGGYKGDNNFDLDPKFLDPADLDYRISTYSPCFNAAKPDVAAPFELAELGTRSIFSSNHSNFNYDIGAYEMENMVADYRHTRPVHNINNNQYYYTIQDAVLDASPYDTITLQPGLYNELITIATDGLTIKSALSPAHLAMHRTIIQAGIVDTEDGDINAHSSPAITLSEMQAHNITLEGITIMDGVGQERTFNFYANEADNKMKVGGGIFSVNNNSLTLRWVNLIHNTADCGGAIALLGCSDINLEHCLITNNTANRKRGGAVWLSQDCYNVTIANCTIAHNTANDTKGAIDSTATQCGGILLEDNFNNVNLTNSILWNNNIYNIHPLNHDNISTSHCILPGNSGTDIYTFDPLFSNISQFDYHLRSSAGRWHTWYKKWIKDSASSPALDVGSGTEPQKAAELYPAGNNVNLGTFGASPQASLSSIQIKSPETMADINRDSQVDISDLAIIAASWYSSDCFDHGDFDRNCTVNLIDLEDFLEGWLQ
ncbi:MAG: right-handed parallel beta-helix repeat-containing protein, partial [Sedimentisphaerales bacterium]|nr:right-handed parallel beta-helix repeat-containing protein [Sedimentisphaerales bacterium]